MSIRSIEDVDLVKELSTLDINVDQKYIHSNKYHKLSKEQYKVMQKIAKAHIDSFDFMIDHGLIYGLKYIRPTEVELPNGQVLRIKITRFDIGTPLVHKEAVTKTRALYPAECRMRGSSYKAPLTLTFSVTINDRPIDDVTDIVGEIPIMLKSKKCNLAGLSPKELVKRYEDAEDFGGYFVINGNEKLIRFLIAQRRNYPLAVKRSGWKDSGQLFTEYGVHIRCVRSDQIGTNMVLHYLNNGTARLRFFYQKQLVFLPIVMVLKALCDVTDQYIYEEMIKGRTDDSYYQSCVRNMLRLVQNEELLNQQHVKQYIGERFRVRVNLPHWYSDEEVTDFVLRECVAIHLEDNVEKFNLLVFMTRKLYKFVKGGCAPENPDNPMFHELYLSGHIYFTLLLERIDNFLDLVGKAIKKNMEIAAVSNREFKPTGANIRRILNSHYSAICRPLDYLLSTGNLLSRTGIGLLQSNGLAVVAEKINYWRFLAHFRCVHRGSSFVDARTTEARKLYPEAWGFMCPVHTPDGTPCGLLNHLSDLCFITNFQPPIEDFISTLVKFGLKLRDGPPNLDYSVHYSVLMDGKEIGYVDETKAESFIDKIRFIKSSGEYNFTSVIEAGFIPKTDAATQYPGIFIFTTPARMLRPVYNLKTQGIELIGTFEQCYMDIAITDSEIHEKTTHKEVKQTSFLSILASFIPYPDFNQSPRNMYACQMGKQTMGTATHTLKYRSDNKMYSILYPQSPLVRPKTHDIYHMDDYPIGTNAVVAVISYTGYDMEDALILNKHAVERGFKFGAIHKTHKIDLRALDKSNSSETLFMFGSDGRFKDKIDSDGLPIIGSKVEYDDPICLYIDMSTGEVKMEKYKSMETAFIADVKILGSNTGKDILQAIQVTFYIPRRPVVGDKFANRHGQKGVCSFLWPCENMPFTGEGLVPDVIFNPHGYPSRMTIGMMLESMAGKSASHHGLIHEATPFIFSENDRASEYYGDMLNKAGYNYFGTEMMYSGVDGRPLKADIFIGVIYYIRLRHMVGDKYQVRSTGPIDSLTHQPVKGRKRCGGIRFGEMERDSLLAHGASFLIHDRLFTQSDKTKCFGCSQCGSIISTTPLNKDPFDLGHSNRTKQVWYCTSCNSSTHVKSLSLPYSLRYLVAELASVGIKLQFSFE